LKPAIYLSALSKPEQYHLGTRISDEPVSVKTPENKLWQPRNFDRQSHGQVMLYQALAKSYNQASARLGMEVGLAEVFDNLYRLGIERELPPVPSVLLGAVELSPLEIATFYHTIANDGIFAPMRAIRAVTSAAGQPLKRYPLVVEQRFAPEPIYLTQFALQATMRVGTGISAYYSLPQELELAGKTGTSNEQRDSWFVGYGGSHLGVVWLGHDDNSPTKLTGSSGALRVWVDMFKNLPVASLLPQAPVGVKFHWLDVDSGKLSQAGCEGAIELPFVAGSEPTEQLYCRQTRPTLQQWWKRLFGGKP
ncbi:MAG: penicillin-binding transpeptidase domain-containing protein, partial [Cellvibrionaceae bacterium]|nr:penicillin-binding transpeptidase domain-containing protein [Cellvibrionaceae bacterium]